MNAKTCKYIDKDKILPALQDRAAKWRDRAERDGSIRNRLHLLTLADQIDFIISDIELGLYDWNQGSE